MTIHKYIVIPTILILIITGITWINKNSDEDIRDSMGHDYTPLSSDIEDKIYAADSWYLTNFLTPTNSTPPIIQEEVTISFIELPQTVQSGEPFTVKWIIRGPYGIKGDNTKLEVLYEMHSATDSSTASSTSKSTQSLGSFTTPQTFDSNFKFSGSPGTIDLKVTALIDGKVLTAIDKIELTN